jgi:polar amino acid transport system substrate-binding protein
MTHLARRRSWWVLLGCFVLCMAAALWVFRNEVSPISRMLAPIFATRDTTWQAMQARGKWRVGMDPSFPPFEQLNADHEMVGFDADLARQMAASWQLELELVPIGFDSLLDAVRTAQIDSVVSAYPYDPRLTRDVLFSSPYFDAGIRLATRTESPIASLEDLAGQAVAVEWGSMGDMVGRRLQKTTPSLRLVQFATPDEAVSALVSSPTIDALLVDNVTLRQAQAGGAALRAVGSPLESSPYVIVMPRTARDLHSRIEVQLQEMRDTGLLESLEEHWFTLDQ